MKLEKKTLGDLVTLQRGYDLPDSDRIKGDVPVVGSAGLTGYHNVAKVKGPCVSMGRSGNSIGKITYTNEDCWPHNACMYVKDFKGNDVRFAFYLLSTIDFKGFNSGGAIPSLNRNLIYPISLKIPPIHKQHHIAAILSAYDDLIENNSKRIKLLEEMAFLSYKMLDKAKKYKLSDLYDTSSGGTPSRTNAEYFTGDINWFKSKELDDSILLESEEKITEVAVDKSSAKIFPTGSVIMAMYGATIGKLGLLSIASTTNQACCAIIAKNEIKSNYYITNWLLENREYILSFRMGAAQENISQMIIKNLLVPIPKDSDLKIFNSEMKPIYQLIKNLHYQNAKLREARDILLPRLMSGGIEV